MMKNHNFAFLAFLLFILISEGSLPTSSDTFTSKSGAKALERNSGSDNLSNSVTINTLSAQVISRRVTWHNPPYCSRTGPVTCNLAVCSYYDQNHKWTHKLYIYDPFCNLIGDKTSANNVVVNVYSQLPYVVVAHVTTNDVGFCYAKSCHSEGIEYYADPTGNEPIIQHAFDC